MRQAGNGGWVIVERLIELFQLQGDGLALVRWIELCVGPRV